MNLITPDQLRSAYELMEAHVNFELANHPKDDGVLRIDLSHITMKFSSKQGYELAERLCKTIEDAGYYCYFSSYYTFFERISIHISLKEFHRIYYKINQNIDRVDEFHFTYHKPWDGHLIKQDAINQLNWVINNRVTHKNYSEVKKSVWQKIFGS